MDHKTADAQPQTASLTIGDLSQRTGLTTAVLRTWETRHGFPVPQRLDSGHRRYTDADVDQVLLVLRRKDAGVRLEVAIEEATQSAPPATPSIFAELRRRHPHLATHRLKKSTLIAISWAIEDECCATAERPILFGAFQRGDLFEPSAHRWAELARVARTAIVFADDHAAATEGRVEVPGLVRASLPQDAPMRREWAVICDAPASAACLTAWELPGQVNVPDRNRVFEAVWTVDPAVVRDAARVAASLAADAGVAAARPLVDELSEPVTRAASAAAADALFNRVIAYADRLS
ncbi:MAG: MerR family transcriptional regulator [Propionibacteriales bacterium]|nr:MerR family transcriptional regulator [Propionibacteriales bacterium]